MDKNRVVNLQGRQRERVELDELVRTLRAGQSGKLVIRGEAGIGKTALLDYLQDHSPRCRVLRAAGVESETELAFGGLHQLCGQLRDHLPLPPYGPVRAALGMGDGSPPDRFSVGLSVLNLLAEVAEDAPLICLVDDVQWLDLESVQTLSFVARRLQAERVALVFAVREPADRDELIRLPELVVRGLSFGDARALLDKSLTGRIDQNVRDRFVAETRGNPRALTELPRQLSAQLAGGFVVPDPRPLVTQLEDSYLRRLDLLPSQTRQLLLVASAEPVGDSALLWRAAELLGIKADAAAPAESVGLIEIGTRVRFRHPLVRAAVYQAASPEDRRSAHQAVADAIDAHRDSDRRAWHRGQAAVGLDASTADELESMAGRAHTRGGAAAVAAFLERAAELTPDPGRRAERVLSAATAKFNAGLPEAAYDLLTAAEIGPMDALERARLARLRAQIVFARHRSEAAPLLLDAADRLEALGDPAARETYLEALGATIFAGRLGKPNGLREAAEAARSARPAPQPPGPLDRLLDAMATRFTDGYVAAVPALREAVRGLRCEAVVDDDRLLRWLWLSAPVGPGPLAADLWDDDEWHRLATNAVGLAREVGSLSVLPVALGYRVGLHLLGGDFGSAAALVDEADAIAEATGNAPTRYARLLLAAWRGEETALTLIEAGAADAALRGAGRAVGLAGYAAAVLHNGLGNYREAIDAARRACEHDDLGLYGWSLAELVEAAVRGDSPELAAEALAKLEERTLAAGTDWALGVLARSRALLSEGPPAEALYQEAIERLGRTRIAVELTRTHLLYGEWLRREHRRQDAREQLHLAHDRAGRIGAEAFAERARRELAATGETIRPRAGRSVDLLTAQEAQIARLAADGLTNAQIASQLFLSPHTVEWHLRKVFSKLGVTSRRHLGKPLAEATATRRA
ncbi:ATP-binding protein [Kribbella sp. CA-247076]|uniref:ATP-binding protein n=1 Tax=Kribbella sp. CA-247076 TaxID=3239941 RepID=UPI003D8F2AA0